jgi:hypothetical protein
LIFQYPAPPAGAAACPHRSSLANFHCSLISLPPGAGPDTADLGTKNLGGHLHHGIIGQTPPFRDKALRLIICAIPDCRCASRPENDPEIALEKIEDKGLQKLQIVMLLQELAV